jgi:hypothetical protein
MKCLACSAEMRLTEVRPDENDGIERHTFRCSACAHMAKRLMLNRSRAPTTNVPLALRPRCRSSTYAQSAWAKAIEKVHKKQTELKLRATATTDWGSVVEKLSAALKQQAGAATAEGLARAIEKRRARQTRHAERMADSEFDRIWYGHSPTASKPIVRDHN